MKHECPQMMELLVDYLDGELSSEQKDHLELHLSLCPPCVAFLESYKSTGAVCKTALQKNMPEEMKSSLSNFLRKVCDEKDKAKANSES